MNLAEQAKNHREAGNYLMALTYAGGADSADCLAEKSLALNWLGRTEEAYRSATLAVEKKHMSRPIQVDCLLALGSAEISMGNYEKALASAHAANELNPKDNPERTARTLILLSGVNAALGRKEKGISCARKALTVLQKGRPRCRAEAYHAIADAYHRAQQYGDAVQAWQAALELRKRCLGPKHPEVATNVDSMALTLRRLNFPKLAISLHQEALKIYQACFDPDHPAIAASYHGLAQSQQRCKQFLQARKNLARALAMSERRLGKDHPDTLITSFELGRIEKDCGETEAGEIRMDEAKTKLSSILEAGHPVLLAMEKWGS